MKIQNTTSQRNENTKIEIKILTNQNRVVIFSSKYSYKQLKTKLNFILHNTKTNKKSNKQE